jgi:prolyl-tRNA synthetase
MADKLTSQQEDFSEWYNQVVLRADLADYAPVRGCMIIEPYGYALWENIQAYLDMRFKEHGAKNAYFPLFIPRSFLQKEAEHVEGFAPQLAVVTIGGGEQLEEPLIVRPTSETIVNDWVRKKIHSYRDLPLLLNLWNNVVRWELRTKLFLRTAEFLWQEGHTSHATFEEADRYARDMLSVYQDLQETQAAMAPIAGSKSESEKFAGALTTYTLEPMMGDRRALQSCTSHNLGDNFARAFNIQYLDRDNALQYVWQTSWGLSTRMVGGIIMTHGDDKGLILPPRLAPTQIVIVPIYRQEEQRASVMEVAAKLVQELVPLRVEVDGREGLTPGFKFNDWELRGVPLRLEVGPKDIEKNQVVFARRDTGEKSSVARGEVLDTARSMLDKIQSAMYARAKKFRQDNTFVVDSYDEFQQRMAGEGGAGFLMAHWCGKASCEKAIQEETRATLRVIPFDQEKENGACIYDGAESKRRVVFAKAY